MEAWLREILPKIGGLRPPATEAELDQAEATLGCKLPPTLRKLYLVSNGLEHPDRLVFPLSDGPHGEALLDQWHHYRDVMEGDDDAQGWIGCDAYPIGSVFGDADTYVLRTNGPGVFKHYPDDGCLDQEFDSVEDWLTFLSKGA